MRKFLVILLLGVAVKGSPTNHCGVFPDCQNCGTVSACTWIVTNKFVAKCIESVSLQLVEPMLTFSKDNCALFSKMEEQLHSIQASDPISPSNGETLELNPESWNGTLETTPSPATHTPAEPSNSNQSTKNTETSLSFDSFSSPTSSPFTHAPVVISQSNQPRNEQVRQSATKIPASTEFMASDPTSPSNGETLELNPESWNGTLETTPSPVTHTPAKPSNSNQSTKITETSFSFDSLLSPTSSLFTHAPVVISQSNQPRNEQVRQSATTIPAATEFITPPAPTVQQKVEEIDTQTERNLTRGSLVVDTINTSPFTPVLLLPSEALPQQARQVAILYPVNSSPQTNQNKTQIFHQSRLLQPKQMKEPLQNRMRRAYCNSYVLTKRMLEKFPGQVSWDLLRWNDANPMKNQFFECSRLLYQKKQFYSLMK